MIFDEFIDIARETFPELVTDEAVERFRALGPAYEDWNSKINVISRKDITGLYSHHVLHSLAVAEFLKTCRPEIYAEWSDGGQVTVLDLGTGGGFPGIPLAILFPGCRFTLCDSIGKKVRVAAEVAGAAGLKNVKCVNARAESLPESYDFIVSRAVATLDTLTGWAKGKYRRGLICLKGGDVLSEISETVRKFRLRPENFQVRQITDWLNDGYYEGKSVIFMGRKGF